MYICHAGLIDFAIPIMIKGQYVGAFLAGQVTSTDFADLKKITTQSEDWKDNQELVELYSQVKRCLWRRLRLWHRLSVTAIIILWRENMRIR